MDRYFTATCKKITIDDQGGFYFQHVLHGLPGQEYDMLKMRWRTRGLLLTFLYLPFGILKFAIMI